VMSRKDSEDGVGDEKYAWSTCDEQEG
jgi:hypothetical protein